MTPASTATRSSTGADAPAGYPSHSFSFRPSSTPATSPVSALAVNASAFSARRIT